jgi:hypothetical protein
VADPGIDDQLRVAQRADVAAQQIDLRERVAVTGEEQHGALDSRPVRHPQLLGMSGPMERIAQQHQRVDGPLSREHARHPAAE